MVIIVKLFLCEAFWKGEWALTWVLGARICRVQNPE